jgi:uncharacterized membrane protein YphA (DoxX/SURF4 family)
MKWLSVCSPIGMVGDVARLCIGIILLVAGASKWRRPPDFGNLLEALGVKANRARLVAVLLISSETTLGIWLLTGVFSKAALAITTTLFAVLTLLLFILVRKEYKGTCACFGSVDNHTVGIIQILRNVVLVIVTLFAAIDSFLDSCKELAVWQFPIEALLVGAVVLVTSAVIFIGLVEMESFLHRTRRTARTSISHRVSDGKVEGAS